MLPQDNRVVRCENCAAVIGQHEPCSYTDCPQKGVLMNPSDNQYTDTALPYTGLPIVLFIVVAVVITGIGVYLRYR